MNGLRNGLAVVGALAIIGAIIAAVKWALDLTERVEYLSKRAEAQFAKDSENTAFRIQTNGRMNRLESSSETVDDLRSGRAELARMWGETARV